MTTPRYLPRSAFEALRAPRPVEARFDGLYVSGEVGALARPTVAIVGTRAATPYGIRAARVFAQECARAGCCVLSGLAVGIDAAAHEGALEAAGPTIGVLGGGHEQFYPKRNRELADRMVAAGGAVLSPFAPGLAAHPPQFLQRNGVVAALADAVVVIEAPARSGALNTATWAAGRVPVFAVPGDIDRPHVQGCLTLIRDGAILARNAGDVLEVLRVLPLPLAPRTEAADDASALTIVHADAMLGRAVCERLAQGECTVDMLCAELRISASEAMSQLTLLEFEGAVESRGGGRYGRTAGNSG